jgi:predicted ribosomally synthesized peptide with nif11-like leader
VQSFNDKVATTPELQAKLRAVTTPVEFLSLAKTEGFELTSPEIHLIAQQAYQQWIEQLEPKISRFFRQVHRVKELNNQLKACQSSEEAIALAQQCGIELTENELKQAARVAETIPSFSFEKLWFRKLGLIK